MRVREPDAVVAEGEPGSIAEQLGLSAGDRVLRVNGQPPRDVIDWQLWTACEELDLLVRLAQEPGSAIRRETLMSDVWDENWFGSTKTLDVHMVALRRKLAEAAGTAGPDALAGLPTITTLRGHGYRLEFRAAGRQT